jgi:hypothetical protein
LRKKGKVLEKAIVFVCSESCALVFGEIKARESCACRICTEWLFNKSETSAWGVYMQSAAVWCMCANVLRLILEEKEKAAARERAAHFLVSRNERGGKLNGRSAGRPAGWLGSACCQIESVCRNKP